VHQAPSPIDTCFFGSCVHDDPTQTMALPPDPKLMLSQEAIATIHKDPHPRLSLQAPLRIAMGSTAAGFLGLALGATQGGKTAHLRFRAEHAHKMPDSTTGWYLYHKSKNYHAAFGGAKEGLKMGAKLALWSAMALSLETTVDRCRGASDMFSTIIASLSVAGAFSLWRTSTSTRPCLR
jgi:hypothetical protein